MGGDQQGQSGCPNCAKHAARTAEHHRATQRCTQCQKEHCVPWPEDLRRAGLVGPRLTALIGYCKSGCHMSYSSIRKFLRDHFRKLFETFHRRDQYLTEKGFQNALLRIRDQILHDALMECPDTREADNLNCRFIDHFESYFRFMTTPGLDPTNNLAEQAIRFVAIHRRITQGTSASPSPQEGKVTSAATEVGLVILDKLGAADRDCRICSALGCV